MIAASSWDELDTRDAQIESLRCLKEYKDSPAASSVNGMFPVNLIVQRMAHVAAQLKAGGFEYSCNQALIHITKVAADAGLHPGKDFYMPPDLLALLDELPNYVTKATEELITFRQGVGITFRGCVYDVEKSFNAVRAWLVDNKKWQQLKQTDSILAELRCSASRENVFTDNAEQLEKLMLDVSSMLPKIEALKALGLDADVSVLEDVVQAFGVNKRRKTQP